jgi:hypothetical protein
VLTAAFWNTNVRDNTNALPRGVLGFFTTSTNFATSGTHTTFQDDGLTVSATYEGNRRLRVLITWTLYVPGGANSITFKVLRGSTEIVQGSVDSVSLAVGGGNLFSFAFDFAGPATGATETFKTQIRGSSNTQVATFAYKTITVEDVGPV